MRLHCSCELSIEFNFCDSIIVGLTPELEELITSTIRKPPLCSGMHINCNYCYLYKICTCMYATFWSCTFEASL